jgi:hypothetical protein
MPPEQRPRLHLSIRPGRLSICRLPPETPRPEWVPDEPFCAVTRTDEELSIVCPEVAVPAGIRCEPGWRALKVAGPLAFELTGVLAGLAVPLARAGIGIFALSTFDTDYVLVQAPDLDRAVEALHRAGHRVDPEPA